MGSLAWECPRMLAPGPPSVGPSVRPLLTTIMLVVVGALVGPVRPDAVAAGGPDPAKACQKGFMDARAPVAATCAEGDLEPGTVTAALAA